MGYGQWIKKARKRRGYTQAQLAEKCGMATITIQQYETDKREPRIEQLQRVANALEISVYELMGISDVEAWYAELNTGVDVYLIASRLQKKFGFSQELAEQIVEECAALLERDGRSEIVTIYEQLLNRLTEEGQQKGRDYLEDLSGNPKYRRIVSRASVQGTSTDE